MKKVLTILLVLFFVLSFSGAAFADDVAPEEEPAAPEGSEDTTVPTDPEDATNSGPISKETPVEYSAATTKATWDVTVPTLLQPGGSGDVTAYGTWADYQYLSVTTDNAVTMYLNGDTASDKMDVGVTFEDIKLYGDYGGAVSATNSVSVASMSNVLFGTWKGTIEFKIQINEDDTKKGDSVTKTTVTFNGANKIPDGSYSVMRVTPSSEYTAASFTDISETVEVSNGAGSLSLLAGEYALTQAGTNQYWLFTVAGTDPVTISNTEITVIHIISTADELKAFEANVNTNGKDYEGETVYLAADVDLTDVTWNPIGQTVGHYFAGTFDGQNHVISNLKVDMTQYSSDSYYAAGLFGWNNAITIQNVKLVNAEVKGNKNVGALIGYITSEYRTSEILNCYVEESTIIATVKSAGALAGTVNLGVTMKDCSANSGSVQAGCWAGQLIGNFAGIASLDVFKETYPTLTADSVTVSTYDAYTGGTESYEAKGHAVDNELVGLTADELKTQG